LFYYKYLFQLQAGSILKCSADKNWELSEPGQYKDCSHKFFIWKFWILSILNKVRKVCSTCINKSKFCVLCSPSFELNWIIFLYYLKGMSLVLWKAFTKRCCRPVQKLATWHMKVSHVHCHSRLGLPVLASYKGP